jgi:hypothetical protein
MSTKIGDDYIPVVENGKTRLVLDHAKIQAKKPVNARIPSRKKQRVASPSRAKFFKESGR